MKNILFFIVLLIVCSSSLANVGGRFYKYGIAGIIPDDSTTILNANTSISYQDSICTFKTIYKVSSAKSVFKGKFFGLNFSNIKINNKPYYYDSSQVVIMQGDSSIFNRNWVLENIPGQYKYKSIKVEIKTNPDSTFIISGNLHIKPASNWGLAGLQDMASIRHPFFGKINLTANEYSVVYLFAPIHSFANLQSVSSKFEGKNIILKNRRLHFKNSFQKHTYNSVAQNDYMSFTDSIPEAIEYRFSKNDRSLSLKHNYFSFGGPVGYIGKKSGKLFYEFGWEFAVNPFRLLSVLPSVNYSFSADRTYWNYGLRFLSMGYNAGILYNEKNGIDYSFGISLGMLGVEFRSKMFLLQLSI